MGKTLQQAHTKNQVAKAKSPTGGLVGSGSRMNGRSFAKTNTSNLNTHGKRSVS